VKLAADANVMLSALIGGRARLIIASPRVSEILTTEKALAEVEEYAVVLARRRRIAEDILLLGLAAMPVTVVPQTDYARSLPQARRRIERRDPDDVDILALALQLKIPLWSNDKDFSNTGVEWLTTEDLLRRFGLI
jgi:predicted nucleic acid-binding protein